MVLLRARGPRRKRRKRGDNIMGYREAALIGSFVFTFALLYVGWWLVYEYAIKVLATVGPLELSYITSHFNLADLVWWRNFIALAFDILIIIIAAVGTIWIIGRLIEEAKEAGKWWAYYRSRKAKKDIWLPRWTWWQRVQHIWILVTFTICAITGFAARLAPLETRHYLMTLHVISGLAMGVLVVIHFVQYLTAFVKALAKGENVREKFPMLEFYSLKYFKNAIKAMLHPFIPSIKPEPFGKYDPEQQFEYWGVYWGMAVLGIPGLIILLWGPQAFGGIFWVTHTKEAVLAVTFILMVHLIHAHFRPSVFPLDPTFLWGKMPLKRALEEHPRWAQEMVRKLKIRK
ncbi:hypothetical protein IPA_09130 [Ignicoccus pacificus DSM 13166]|uniref:Cytochrome b561 bacterial/Ni-hydrogenase domain-containing protein n=1 Tax=Ignicoccus pacificus DSM 13166 TaxID=940294 RepID=A0A977PLV4_9CREN|nr:hypothetical protein IPA_09130 [Ignicoccus pacificus DSM 13166]